MKKSFIIGYDERNHVQYRKDFNIVTNLTELPSEDNLKDAEITRINADPENKSASAFELYKIKFASGNVDYYALEIPYNRAARAKVESDRIIISVINFDENGFQPDQFDFMINEYTGFEWCSIEELEQIMYDYCRDQLDSVFGLLADDDYEAIYDAIDEWCEKYIMSCRFDDDND